MLHFVTDGVQLYQLDELPPAVLREHPGCGFVRKHTPQGLTSTLHTPQGRLRCLWGADGTLLKPYIKKPADVDTAGHFFRAVQYLPPLEGGAPLLACGPSPLQEACTQWLGTQAEAALKKEPEALPRMQRRLQQHFLQRAQLARGLGAVALVVEDDLPGGPVAGEWAAHYAVLREKTGLALLVTCRALPQGLPPLALGVDVAALGLHAPDAADTPDE